jgi:hypothetical protein
MLAAASIFLNFRLPNSTTWFYFSLILAVALYFKFSRLLSMRNWDVLTIFLLVPGLLLLQEGHMRPDAGGAPAQHSQTLLWIGYLWLLAGSAYFVMRCLLDLALVRRPAITPNLNSSGLAWMALALSVCLVSVAIKHQEGSPENAGKAPAAVEATRQQVAALVDQQTARAIPGIDIDTAFWVSCGLAVTCHLAVIIGLIVIGRQIFQDTHIGVAMATFYLILPYTAFFVGQIHHVWLAALLVWAIATYRRPLLAGFLLGVAAGTVFSPALLFFVWLGFYWRRGAGRFATAFVLAAVLCLAATGAILWMQGELLPSLKNVMALSDWQPWKRPTTEGFWLGIHGEGVHWGYRIPVFILYIAGMVTTAFWPSPKTLAHVIALSAAGLIGIQFWYADQGGIYVLWYLPLLLLMAFRPNLADRRPALIVPETDLISRAGKAAVRAAVFMVKHDEPLVRVR